MKTINLLISAISKKNILIYSVAIWNVFYAVLHVHVYFFKLLRKHFIFAVFHCNEMRNFGVNVSLVHTLIIL